MKMYKRVVPLVVASVLTCPLMLAGCAQQYANPQQAAANSCSAFGPRATSGALIGGLGGAAAGAAIGGLAGRSGTDAAIGALAGGLLGAIAGGAVGHHFDQRDCAAAQAALQQVGTSPTGQPVVWSDASTGSHGTFIPIAAEYTDPKTGLICRPIQASYYMNGHQPVTGETGNVCRDANGDWYRQTAGT